MDKPLLLISLLAVIFPGIAGAQTAMRDLWVQMPDSIVAYLDKEKRAEIAELYQAEMKTETKNKLDGTTVMDTLTDDFACITLNASATMQIKKLEAGNSFVICVVRNFNAPETDSEINFFSPEWKPLDGDFGLPNTDDAERTKAFFTERPDSITAADYNERLSLIDPVMLCASLSADGQFITLTITTPLINSEERKSVVPIIRKRKFRWEGQSFAPC